MSNHYPLPNWYFFGPLAKHWNQRVQTVKEPFANYSSQLPTTSHFQIPKSDNVYSNHSSIMNDVFVTFLLSGSLPQKTAQPKLWLSPNTNKPQSNKANAIATAPSANPVCQDSWDFLMLIHIPAITMDIPCGHLTWTGCRKVATKTTLTPQCKTVAVLFSINSHLNLNP